MKNILLISFVFVIQTIAFSQNTSLSGSDSLIFKAMKDEMNRSMTEYSHPEAGKFFYILYQIDDGQSTNTIASLGSIINSTQNNFRSQSYRIMLGDYNFNDENFINTSDSERDDYSNLRTEIPLGDDYMGIRRALWNYTEIAFENCVKSYLDKKNFFKENPKKLPTITDYTKIDSIKHIENSSIKLIDKTDSENLTRKISSIFKEYEKITESVVVFNQTKINVYLLSTEGVMIKTPLDYVALNISAGIKNDSNAIESTFEKISFYENDPKNLIKNIDKIILSTKKLAEYIQNSVNFETIKEDYSGPLMLSENASAEFFNQVLFNYENSLTARREQISENQKFNKYSDLSSNIAEKIGKKIAPIELTVIDKPKLTEFNNKKLLGSYKIDQEAVTPPEELVLIQSGELKTLLHDRVPTPEIEKSNGHLRLGVSQNSSLRDLSASNLFVDYKSDKNKTDIKNNLIELCKENNLEFGIEIRSLDTTADFSPLVYYKIDLNGNEEIINPLKFPNFDLKSLNKIKACTKEKSVTNTLGASYNNYNNRFSELVGGLNGCFVSIISPKSILLKEIELEKLNVYDRY